MTWSRTPEWREASAAMRIWWQSATGYFYEIDEDGEPLGEWRTAFWLETHAFVAALDRAEPGFDATAITEFYGRLAGFYDPRDHFAIDGTFAELKLAMTRAQWLYERINTLSIVSEKPKNSADTPKFSASTHTLSDPLAQVLLNARIAGDKSGVSAETVNIAFRKKYRKELGKTDTERKSRFETLSRTVRRAINRIRREN